MLHHHQYKYQTVTTKDQVERIFLDLLDEAAMCLSPHDPLRAAVVNNASDMYIRSLKNAPRAREVIERYLEEVDMEPIQAVSTIELVVTSAGAAPAAPLLNPPLSPRNAFATVTTVRRGQQATSAARAPDVVRPGGAVTPTAAERSGSKITLPAVIPSWNSGEEKTQFLAVIATLRGVLAQLEDSKA
jgi:hypothetical protein